MKKIIAFMIAFLTINTFADVTVNSSGNGATCNNQSTAGKLNVTCTPKRDDCTLSSALLFDNNSEGAPVKIWSGSGYGVGATYTYALNSNHNYQLNVSSSCKNYSVSSSTDGNGSLSFNPSYAEYGTAIKVTISPKDGYELASISSSDVTLSGSGNTRSFAMPKKDVTVNATFKAKQTYAIATTNVTNGSMEVSPSNGWEGRVITVTPSAYTGYEVDSVWYCTLSNCSASEKKKISASSNKYTFTMPASNVWVGAAFKAKLYTITFKFGSKTETSQVKYGVVPTAPASFKCSANTAEYTYSCKWDKAFAKVKGEATYTFIESKTKNSYVVNAAVNDAEMGSVSGLSETGKYEYGTEVKLTAVAKTGYEFTNWNDGVKTVERTIKVIGNVTYTATFKAKLYTITFVYVENGETINEEIESVEYGAVPTAPEFFVCPDNTAEYTYKCAWEKDFAAVIGEDTYTFNISKTKKKYTVTFKFGDEIVTEDVAYGDEPTAPESFVCPDNTAEYTYKCAWDNVIVPVEEDATYEYLKFEDKNSYVVEVAVNDAEMGSVSGLSETGVYFYGTEVKLTAEAKTGYEFSNWNDDVKTAERTITVTGDMTYTATFKAIKSSSSEGVSSSSVESSSSEGVSSSSVESSSSESESSSGVESSDSKFSSSSTKITSSSSAKSSSSSAKAKSSSSKKDDGKSSSSSAKAKSSSSSAKAKSSSSKGKDAIVAMAQLPQFSVTAVARDLQIAGAKVGAPFAILDMQGRVMTSGRVESANFNLAIARAGTFMVRIADQVQVVTLR